MDWSSTVAPSSPTRERRRRWPYPHFFTSSRFWHFIPDFFTFFLSLQVNIDFEPFKPINTSLYLCDNKFHTGKLCSSDEPWLVFLSTFSPEALTALLADDNRFGFIVMDGNGALFGTLQGNTRDVLHKFTVDLPKKHGRGGQSALRFARLRMEKRHNYVRKVAEVAVQLFISNDKPNCSGLILAGSADFKTELSQSDMFDSRLQVSHPPK